METLQNGLNVEVTETAPCCFGAKVMVPAKLAQKTYSDVLNFYQARIPQKGFRAGHTPRQLVLTLHGKAILAETAEQLINNSMRDVFSEKKYDLAGGLKLKDGQQPPAYVNGQDYTFEVVFEAFQPVTVPEYKGLPIEHTPHVVSDDDVQAAVDTELRMRGSYDKSDNAAVEGDMVKVAYHTEAPEELKDAKNVAFLLNNDNSWQILRADAESLPGMTKAIVGHKAGEELDHTIEFPADFRNAQLAGKTLTYHVTVNEVHSFKPAELNEELFKSMNYKDLDDMKAKMRQRMEANFAQQDFSAKAGQAVKLLLANQTFPLPPTLVADNCKAVVSARLDHERQHHKASEEELAQKLPEIEKEVRQQVEEDLRLNRILDAIAAAEKLEASQQDLMQWAFYQAQRSGQNFDKFLKEFPKNQDLIYRAMTDIRRQKALSAVVEQAKAPEAPAQEPPAAEAAPAPEA